MGENTAIAWCDHTFNYVWGCSKISVGPLGACEHCYAEAWAKRVGYSDLWSGQYRTFGEKHWREPLRWNAAAQAAGVRRRVFCSSMADVFDKNAPEMERAKLWPLIRSTPSLDWLLLTKRIGNAAAMLPPDWHDGYPNVWLGETVATQAEADRDVPKLLDIPAVVRFLSIEPMLGSIVVPRFVRLHHDVRGDFPIGHHAIARAGLHVVNRNPHGARSVRAENGAWLGIKPAECADVDVDWIICGGESGTHARPMLAQWCHSLREQCATAGIAYFMKQGSQANWGREFKDIASFPPELRVREWPRIDAHA